jgi:Glycosyl transferase family 2
MTRLALNTIVGPGDGSLLARLMSQYDMRKLFDEIVLVRTTDDPEVINVINQFADKTAKFEWCTPEFPKGNFGGARNMALQMTDSEWVMWLDSDDMLASDEDIEKVFKRIHVVLKEHADRDYFVCPYILSVDPEGNPTNKLDRERIFKRASTIKWDKPAHEQLTVNLEIHKRADLNGLDILHFPAKSGETSAARNVEILENEYWKGCDRHTAFYLARDLVQLEKWERAVPLLVDFINTAHDDIRLIYESALMLAKFFLYKQGKEKVSLCETTAAIAERYIRICLAVTDTNAEPYAVLGDSYIAQQKRQEAIRMFKLAMSKPFGSGSLKDRAYYEEIPARRLSEVLIWENDLEQALWYNKIAMKHDSKAPALIEQRKKIINKLQETICQ